jgi:AcrR family transcriptional regulator
MDLVRGKPREEAILSAAIALLGELGYDGLTMDAVAARAHASKATMYRRWRNKPELVKAALDALDAKDNAMIPDTGALRSDLVAVMQAARDKATAPYMAMILDLVVAARRDPALGESLRAHIENEELSPFRVVLQRAMARKALPVGAPTELVHEVAEAMISRQLQTGSAFDDTFIRRVVDDVLLPLLGKKRSRK